MSCEGAPRPTFLGLEPLLVERLSSALPGNVRVLSLAEVAGATEASLPKPSVRVAYFGHQVVPPQGGAPLPPGWVQVEQTWLVVPAVRNVQDIKAGAPGRAEISPLCDVVLDALDGWQPSGGYGRLKSITPALRPATIDGCTYVPLAFTTRFRRTTECK